MFTHTGQVWSIHYDGKEVTSLKLFNPIAGEVKFFEGAENQGKRIIYPGIVNKEKDATRQGRGQMDLTCV